MNRPTDSRSPHVPTGPRARDLGIPFDGTPGPLNAITDVSGVAVGHTTLIEGDGPLVIGRGPVRTGVTVILPAPRLDPLFAGWYALNGNGEMTGTHWIEEAGFLEGPIAITNTHSVGIVRDSIISWQVEKGYHDPDSQSMRWMLPVVAETYDGLLNDINGQHIRREHVFVALEGATTGPVAEGCVGGGTGMVCHEFKGGIGTASRKLPDEFGGYTLGVLVQANHGARRDLTIAGIPVGLEIPDLLPVEHGSTHAPPGSGSVIVVVATDAPLLPYQLKRLARRVPIGLGRVGAMGSHSSGDIFLAFSTANPDASRSEPVATLHMLSNEWIDPLFVATIQATEEAVVNALVAARTMTGINGNVAFGLPHDRLRDILRRYRRLAENASPQD